MLIGASHAAGVSGGFLPKCVLQSPAIGYGTKALELRLAGYAVALDR